MRTRTFAPRGQTPILKHHFNWKTLSGIFALSTSGDLHFLTKAGAIDSHFVEWFLRGLLSIRPGKLLIIWDGAPIHRATNIKKLLEEYKERLRIESLPAYAPELQPAELVFSSLKSPTALGNYCAETIENLNRRVTIEAIKKTRHAGLIDAWLTGSKLPLTISELKQARG